MATLVIKVEGRSSGMYRTLGLLQNLGGKLNMKGYKVQPMANTYCWINPYGDIRVETTYDTVLDPYMVEFYDLYENIYNIGEKVLVGEEQDEVFIERVMLDDDGITLKYKCSDGNEYVGNEIIYLDEDEEEEDEEDEEYNDEEDEEDETFDTDHAVKAFAYVCDNMNEVVYSGKDLDVYRSLKKLLMYMEEHSYNECEGCDWIHCLGHVEKKLMEYEED